MRRGKQLQGTEKYLSISYIQYSPSLNQVPLKGEKKNHCPSKWNARVVAEGWSGTVRPHQFSVSISTWNIPIDIGLANTPSIIPCFMSVVFLTTVTCIFCFLCISQLWDCHQHMVTLKDCTQGLTVCSAQAWPHWPFWLFPHHWYSFFLTSC